MLTANPLIRNIFFEPAIMIFRKARTRKNFLLEIYR